MNKCVRLYKLKILQQMIIHFFAKVLASVFKVLGSNSNWTPTSMLALVLGFSKCETNGIINFIQLGQFYLTVGVNINEIKCNVAGFYTEPAWGNTTTL